MRSFVIKPGDLIPIGRAGENQATEIRFDVTGWAETFGAGTFELIMQRPGDSELPYPVEVTVDGGYVVWTVSNVDTGIAGNCKIQLRYVVSDAVAKSAIYRGIVGESLDHVVDPPDPYDDLIELLTGLTERAESAAESASGSAGTATTAAETAQTAKTAAETAAGQAQSAKESAQASATTATQAKTAAQTAQSSAEAAKSAAAQSATAASGSATAAAGSATAASGSATAAATSATAAQVARTAAEAITPQTVTSWLDTHVTQETGYVIDDSLTIQGAAADAKAVGDILKLFGTQEVFSDSSLWARATVGQGGGSDAIGTTGFRFESSTTRLAIRPLISTGQYTKIKLTPQSGYKYDLFIFDAALTTAKTNTAWQTDAHEYTINGAYVTILIAKTTNGTITLDDYDKVLIEVTAPDGRISEIEDELANIPASNVYAGMASFDESGLFVGRTVGVSSGKINYESSTTRISSYPPIKVTSKTYRVTPSAGYKAILYTFSDDTTFSPSYASQSVWRTEEYVYEIPDGITHIVLLIAKTDDSAITTADFDKVTVIAYENMQDVVEDLYAKLPTSLPDYWMEYLTEKQPTLTAAGAALGFNGVSFAFVTDVHINNNNKVSPLLLKYLTTHTSIRDVVCGGDIVTNYNTKANAEKELQWWASETSELDIVNLHGNHDNNSNGQTDNTQTLTNAEFYALECRPAENYVHYAPGHLYGYRDNEAQKVRYIYLDTGAPDAAVIGSTQIAWLKSRIEELATGWAVVVFAHQFWTGANTSTATLTLDGNGTAIMNALDSIYDSIAATIACVVVGHCHRDYNMTSAKGYPIIATTCDAGGTAASTADPDQPTRTPGTTTEQALDLYYIDTANKTIKTIRIGAGDTTKDRNFTY